MISWLFCLLISTSGAIVIHNIIHPYVLECMMLGILTIREIFSMFILSTVLSVALASLMETMFYYKKYRRWKRESNNTPPQKI
jgi:phosphate/sulfate permease